MHIYVKIDGIRGDIMIILSSDYDGTLKTTHENLYINIAALRKFIKLGNIFILNTGRSYSSIKEQIRKYHIPFNYLCCNDGAAIFNRHFGLVHATYLSSEQKSHIKDLVACRERFRINHFYTAKEKLTIETECPIKIEVGKEPEDSFQGFLEALKAEEMGLSAYPYQDSLYIKGNVSKSLAIHHVLERIEPSVNPQNVYTIGDEGNDLEMIMNHNGFRMEKSSPELIEATSRTVPEAYVLIRRLIAKSKKKM